MSEQSLKDKTIKGVGWSAIDNISQHAVTFIVSIVLARLLTPEDYGLLGITAIFTTICRSLINCGFGSAIIRKKDATDDDYSTAFIINTGMSIFLYTVIFLGAPFIAHFFGRIELVALTRVSSLALIINALSLVQQTRLTKRIDFKTQTKISLISSIISGVVGIIMAALGFGVWSLVAQHLSSSVLRTIFLWIFNRWTPHLHFSKNSFKYLFGFGWKLMASGLLDSAWKELYQVIVAKFYSPGTLGQYTRAKGFAKLFSENLTSIIQRVTYPVLSDIQDDQQRLVAAYRRMIKTTMFVSASSMFFLGAVSETLIFCLIGSKWQEAAVYLPLICISSSMYPIQSINLNMLQVKGRSDLFLGLEIIKKIIAIVPLMVGAFVGILPMLYVNLGVTVISYFLNSYYSGKFIGYNSWMQLKDIAPSYGIATVVAVAVWILKYLPFSYWIILPIQIVVGGGLFLCICHVAKFQEYNEVKQILTPFFKRLKKQK